MTVFTFLSSTVHILHNILLAKKSSFVSCAFVIYTTPVSVDSSTMYKTFDGKKSYLWYLNSSFHKCIIVHTYVHTFHTYIMYIY